MLFRTPYNPIPDLEYAEPREFDLHSSVIGLEISPGKVFSPLPLFDRNDPYGCQLAFDPQLDKAFYSPVTVHFKSDTFTALHFRCTHMPSCYARAYTVFFEHDTMTLENIKLQNLRQLGDLVQRWRKRIFVVGHDVNNLRSILRVDLRILRHSLGLPYPADCNW